MAVNSELFGISTLIRGQTLEVFALDLQFRSFFFNSKKLLVSSMKIVPNPPQTLVRFVREFRNRIKPDQRPIIVHCSAGVGRSGTFIALDRILQQIKVCDYVDIFNIVYTMRKGMISD